MGKAARWFRGLLGLKKEDSSSQKAAKPPKRRWSFVKSHREREHAAAKDTADNRPRYSNGNGRPATPGYADCDGGVDPNKHAIAVAAASAAVADAAVAAAQAAAEVVRLTSSGRSNATTATSAVYVTGASCGVREDWAAVKIQAYFRGYLARRALRALKGLVKLQALVRGYIVRKQTTDMLRRMQALLRAQKRARAGRTQISESSQSSSKSSQFLHPGPATPEKFEHAIRSKSTKRDQLQMFQRSGSKSIGRVDSQSDGGSWDQRGLLTKNVQADDENSDRILEVDTGKTHLTPNHKIFIHPATHRASASDQFSYSFSTSKDSTTHQTGPSPASCEVHSLNPLKSTEDVPESPFFSANNSPQFYSASSRGGSSRRGPFTPTKSDSSRSYLSGYSDHPSYMGCTESSRAKIRSFSAPKQRPYFERSVSSKRYSVHGRDESRLSTQRVSSVHANFVNKAYPGSGRLDRLGMPVRVDTTGLNADHWSRY